MSKFMLLIGIFLLGGASFYNSTTPLGNVYNKIERSAQKKYSFTPIARGISSPDGIIQSIAVDFKYEKPMTIEEAREVMISLVGEAIQAINSEKDLRDHLVSFPFDYKNISIGLLSSHTLDKKLKAGDYVVFTSDYGRVEYCPLRANLSVDFYGGKEETFQQALDILNEQGRLPQFFKKQQEDPQ